MVTDTCPAADLRDEPAASSIYLKHLFLDHSPEAAMRRALRLSSVAVLAVLAAVLIAMSLTRAADRPPRKVALVVGVAHYDHDFHDLDFPERDAEELGQTLRDGGFEVVVLTGSAEGKDRATRQNVEGRLAELLDGGGDETKKIRKGDLVLVALSGHGLQMEVADPSAPDGKREDAFFCPVDAIRTKPATLESLSRVLDEELAPYGGRNLLLVDACREIADPNKGKGIEGRDIALKGETAVLFSCGRGEKSWESRDLKHGVFTYAVLKGLKGDAERNGVVTWTSLVDAVQEEMSSDDFKKLIPDGYTQTPIPTSGQLPRTVLLAPGKGARPSPLDCTGEKGVSAADVRKAQEAWAKYLGRQVEEEDEIAPGVKMKFVLIPPGKFLMGSPQAEKDYVRKTFGEYAGKAADQETLHEVVLTRPIYLGVYDVTQAEYEAVTRTNPSYYSAVGDGKVTGVDTGRFPVERVRWEDADAFRKKLTEKARDGMLYRLPTEAEWEYSCRGGRPSSMPFGIGGGTSLSSHDANFDGNYPYGGAEKGPYLMKPTPVGTYKENALGLFDMQGNVCQWCLDWDGDYPTGPVVDPQGPETGSIRVFRGGSMFDSARTCSAANRNRKGAGIRINILGFRLARVPSGLSK
jgi:formylglycine-generating enzyme required for sulfatase activity